MASILNVGNITGITNTNTTYIIKNGYYTNGPGQIIEYLSRPCDGGTMTGASGTYTVQNVTTQQATTDTWTTVTGSLITYTPPPGTITVVYRFTFGIYSVTTHDIVDFAFYVAGYEVPYARHNRSGQYIENRTTFEWHLPTVQGSNATTNNGGAYIGVGNPTQLYMMTRRYGASNYGNLHGSRYWDGGASNQFQVPCISIEALSG